MIKIESTHKNYAKKSTLSQFSSLQLQNCGHATELTHLSRQTVNMRKVGHRQSIYAAAGSNNFLIGQDMILVHVLLASLEAAAWPRPLPAAEGTQKAFLPALQPR